MRKQDVLTLLEGFPEEFDADLLMERIYLRLKLDKAEEDIRNGNVISDEDFEKETQQWFK